jgi:menaquinone-dependent protoporphyrinogen oxidase
MNPDKQRIAVVYATASGTTADIAQFIADELLAHDAVVELADVAHAPELTRFDAVVFGSAIHRRAFLPEAVEYIDTHKLELLDRDVWLFGVGLGPALRGPIGRRIARAVPKHIAVLRDSILPHEYHSFAGRYDRAGVDLAARTAYRLVGGPRYGDLRDWGAIRRWTATIATALQLPPAKTATMHP